MAPNYTGMEEPSFRPMKLLCGCRNPIGVGDGKSHLDCTVTCDKCGVNYVVRFADAVKQDGEMVLPSYYYLEKK